MRWDFSGINYLAVIVVVIANFVIGMAWYGGMAGQWMKATGLTKEQARKMQALPLAFSAARSFVAAMAVNLIFDNFAPGSGIAEGAGLGLLIGVGLAGPNVAMHNLFAMKKDLAVIDGAHTVVEFLVMGLIIGAWQ